MPPTPVKVSALTATPVPQSTEYVATIRSRHSTTVQPQVEGIVRRIMVQAGDRVREGQPLVQIDPDRQQASLATIESQRLAREADVSYARQQLTRMQQLFEAGAVSRSDLDQAETAAKTSQAQLAATESQLQEQRVQLAYYLVTAPAAGILGEIPVREGDRITPTSVITTIDQAEGLEAYISVPLERAAALRTGLMVELLDSEDHVVATEPISFIAPRADDTTQSVLAKATLRRIPPSTRVMQYIRARLIWSNEPRLLVPVVAVSRIAGQYFIFVATPGDQGDVARQRPITVGELVGDEYVVTSGLAEGDRVIVSNTQKLMDGAPVAAE